MIKKKMIPNKIVRKIIETKIKGLFSNEEDETTNPDERYILQITEEIRKKIAEKVGTLKGFEVAARSFFSLFSIEPKPKPFKTLALNLKVTPELFGEERVKRFKNMTPSDFSEVSQNTRIFFEGNIKHVIFEQFLKADDPNFNMLASQLLRECLTNFFNLS